VVTGQASVTASNLGKSCSSNHHRFPSADLCGAGLIHIEYVKNRLDKHKPSVPAENNDLLASHRTYTVFTQMLSGV